MDQLIERRREEIKRLATRRGIRNVRIFGSMARDDAGPDSDVDLLVELEQGRSAFALGGLLSDLQALLGRRVEVVTEAALHPAIRDEVMNEAVPL